MTYRIVSLPAAEADIRDAISYYQKINPKLGIQFLYRLRDAAHFLASTPKGFQLKYKEVRTLLLKQFPYHIHYLIDENKRTVIVLAVIHSYQNPKDYSVRL
jgi:plasmid stabilization system protein ParE